MKNLAAVSCLLLSPLTMAAQYQSFNNFESANASGYDGFSFTSHYFFTPQTMVGVLDEFGYLNTDTNAFVTINNFDDSTYVEVGGEYFFDNGVFAIADYVDVGSYNGYRVGAGYLLNANTKLSLFTTDGDDQSSRVFAKAEYNHPLQGNDYLAATIQSESNLDQWQVSGRYFTALNQSQHMSVDVSYLDTEYDSTLSVFANYYVNQAISIGAGFSDSQPELRAKYYVDTNFAIYGGYADEGNVLTFGLSGQF